MTKVVLDIEANGLLEYATKIHVAVTQDYDTKEFSVWLEKDKEALKLYLQSAELVIGHNIIAYDAPMLLKHWGISLKLNQLEDTLILSRLQDSTKLSHSLRAWGDTLQYPKGDCEDFSVLTDDMIEYCKRDVDITAKVYQLLSVLLQGTPKLTRDIEKYSQYILEKQKTHGFLLDVEKILKLKEELDREYMSYLEKFKKLFPPRMVVVSEYLPKRTKNGELGKVSKRILESDAVIFKDCEGNVIPEYVEGCKVYRVKWVDFCIDSPKEIVERLEGYWKPTVFTEKRQPKVCEANLDTILDTAPPELKLLKQCKICKSRSTLLQTYLDSTRGDERAHGSVTSIGTKSHRMSHTKPNTGNIPSVKSYKGEECREVFTVPKGYKLVGCDASGIQLRALAHYVNDPVLIEEILSGDIHAYLASQVYGLTGDDARSRGKTITYSILMGAGVSKIASLAGTDTKGGKAIMENLSNRIHGWSLFKKKIQKVAYEKGFRALDKSWIPLENAHYGMSLYLQSFEQAIMKLAMVNIYKAVCKAGIDAHQVAVVHDEFQYEVEEDRADELAKIMEDAIKNAGVFYHVRCPLDAEAKVGNNWKETH